MNDRRLTDAQIANALRAHLPTAAPTETRRILLDAVEVTAQQRPLLPALGWLSTPRIERRTSLVLLVALLAAALLAGLAAMGTRRLVEPRRIANGWIAYATDRPLTDATTGSDIYVVREGGVPILIAGRDGGTRNACPSFSPDGTKLAYGMGSGPNSWIVLRGASAGGITPEIARIKVSGDEWPVCVRWSADGTRLAYLDGTIEVVRGLDGSSLSPTRGDPSRGDFASGFDVRSPSGDRTVQIIPCEVIVKRPDGTDTRFYPDPCPGPAVGWSPDGTKFLWLEDVSARDDEFTIHAFDTDSGADSVVVAAVKANGSRSMPGWGDVSWQPIVP